MAYLDDFELDTEIIIYRELPPDFDPVTGEEIPGGLQLIGIADGFYWTGSNAEGYVSERLRSTIDGLVVVYPGTDIELDDKVEINGKDYRVVGIPDDIALRGEVILCPVALYG